VAAELAERGVGLLLFAGGDGTAVGIRNIIVAATQAKLVALGGRPLLVDTGDAELDEALAGYARVVTGFGEESVYRVVA
jgi:predicted polyphosphate/ATP-dependent NAD kinase